MLILEGAEVGKKISSSKKNAGFGPAQVPSGSSCSLFGMSLPEALLLAQIHSGLRSAGSGSLCFQGPLTQEQYLNPAEQSCPERQAEASTTSLAVWDIWVLDLI